MGAGTSLIEGECTMPTKEWAQDRDDETGRVAETKAAQPKMVGNPARGKPNDMKADETHRGRQTPKSEKGDRIDVGAARKNAR
jgi:hypothetical protein